MPVAEPTTVSGGESKRLSVPRARALDTQGLSMGWEGSRREIGVLGGEGRREGALGGGGRRPPAGYLTALSLRSVTGQDGGASRCFSEMLRVLRM